MDKSFPARLHIVLASASSKSVIFRRGPSKAVCTFLWDRKTDSIEIGQWLKGKIYERRFDISPDGKYLIYFAMNGRWDSETKGSWTAISKAPWLKAIELHPKGDCWEGGGLFLSKNTYWLNDRYANINNKLVTSSSVIQNKSYVPEGNFGAEDTGVYYRRLIRDGWVLSKTEVYGKWNEASVFTKEINNCWRLTKIAHEQVDSPVGKGCYWDEHLVENTSSGVSYLKSDWEWAEGDGNSVIWCSGGRLFRASLNRKSELGEGFLIQDFNQYKFEKIKAPY
jgi:hypothetical protein